MAGSDAKRPRQDNDEEKNQDDWKNQPPYAPDDSKQKKKVLFTGDCHCKDVTFEIYVDKPKGSHFCQ